MSLLLTLARLPSRRQGRVFLAVLGGGALLLNGPTHGRSLGVLSFAGIVALLHGWGMLTNWGGIWDDHAEREGRHHHATGELPLGRTRAGRVIRDWNRQDDAASRGMAGAAAIIVGPAFIVLGILAAAGMIDFNS